MKIALAIYLFALLLAVSGCTSVVEHVGISVLYKKTNLPEAQIHRDVPYREGSTLPKNQLDLFLPSGRDWPVLIFVHGGGWTKGDKSLRVGGADVYGNIGRFYAAHGIGVAVVNYRLLPGVTWQEQLDDVAAATAWVQSHIAAYGGNPRRLFISGHSAGGQLAARVALDPRLLEHYGLSTSNVCGAICVSGAGFDLADEKTYELGASRAKYEQIFGGADKDWKKEGSPVTYVRPGAPPFLILYAGGEKKPLQRQAQRLGEVLSTTGIKNQVIVVLGENHERIVLTLSRSDRTAGPAILNFIQTTRCE
jgi:acetyl esterase/lipase